MAEGLSVADALALQRDGYDGDNDMMGGGFFWIVILFLFAFMGGGNGFGFGNNGVAGQITNDFLFNNLSNQLGRIQDQNVGLANGIQQGLCNIGYETLSNFKDLSAQNAQCCCETNRNIDSVRYENAKNTCDIITSANANTQRIIDTLTQNEITSLRTELQSAQLQLSNSAQTQNIVGQLKPFPVPAYITCSPYTSPCGFNGGCGCN